MAQTILLIEDEADTVSLYTHQLKQDGFEVVTADNVDVGLWLAKEKNPKLILLDLMLPGKSGFDFLKEAKKNPATKDIPILALTNLAEEVGFERALQHGAIGYVVKAERTPRQVTILIRQILQEKGSP